MKILKDNQFNGVGHPKYNNIKIKGFFFVVLKYVINK